MSKRLSDTEKWMDGWFRRLPTPCKILWLYMLDRCDMAGVWEIDLDLFQVLTGVVVSEGDLKGCFSDRLHFFDNGKKVWIRKFIDFQNGQLDEDSKSPIIQSVIRLLKKHTLFIPYKQGFYTHKEKEEVIVKEEDKEKEEENGTEKIQFEEARKLYPGSKRGLETEFDGFKKKHRDWQAVIPLLLPAITAGKKHRDWLESIKKKDPKVFIANWKNFQTWINGRFWEEQFPVEVFT